MSNTNKIDVKPDVAGQAGIKPFCVKTSDFAEQEIIEIVLLMVDAGIGIWDCISCPEHSHLSTVNRFVYDTYQYWGYSSKYGTYTLNETRVFDNNVLSSMEEVYNYLGIKQEKPTMKQQPIKQAVQAQTKSSNKGLKILPKTSNLLEFIYAESKYTVRGVTSFEIVHEAHSLFLKYDFHRTNQNGHVQGSEKIKIFGDLEKIIFKTPSDFDKNVYKQKTVLNLKG